MSWRSNPATRPPGPIRISAAHSWRGIEGFRLTRAFVVSPDGSLYLDTVDDAHVGSHAYLVDAAVAEMAAAMSGEAATSVVFHDPDGNLIKSAYAPVSDRSGNVIGVLVVEASARFLHPLDRIQNVMFVASSISAVAIIVLLILLSVSIVRPILRLRRAAAEIAGGEYTTVHGGGASELRFLATSFNTMSHALKKNEQQLRDLYQREAKRAEDLEDFAGAILRGIANGIVSIDGEGTIQVCNSEACRILAARESEMVGHSMDVLPQSLGELIEQVLERGAPSRRDVVHFKNNKGDAMVVSAAASRNPGGASKIEVNLILTDQTEVHQLQEKVKRQETLAAIGQLAAHVAHEVRNPLSSIKVYMDLIGRASTDAIKQRDFIDKVSGEISRLDEIVTDFLEYSAPTRMNETTFVIAEVIDDAVMFSQKREESGVDFRVVANTGADVFVRADRNQIMQLLLNLMINAADAMPDGGVVTADVQFETGSSVIAVAITDTGTGIAEEVRDEIFKPFVSTKTLGTGLGLAMVQRVVDNHGGDIDVVSRPGEGTTVTVTLPIVARETEPDRSDQK